MPAQHILLVADLLRKKAYIAPSTLVPNTHHGLFDYGSRPIQADTLLGHVFGGLSYHNLMAKEKMEHHGAPFVYFAVNEKIQTRVRMDLPHSDKTHMMVQGRMSKDGASQFRIVSSRSCAFS